MLPFERLTKYAEDHGLTSAQVGDLKPGDLTVDMVGEPMSKLANTELVKGAVITIARTRLEWAERRAEIVAALEHLGFASVIVKGGGKGRFVVYLK